MNADELKLQKDRIAEAEKLIRSIDSISSGIVRLNSDIAAFEVHLRSTSDRGSGTVFYKKNHSEQFSKVCWAGNIETLRDEIREAVTDILKNHLKNAQSQLEKV